MSWNLSKTLLYQLSEALGGRLAAAERIKASRWLAWAEGIVSRLYHAMLISTDPSGLGHTRARPPPHFAGPDFGFAGLAWLASQGPRPQNLVDYGSVFWRASGLTGPY